MSKRTTLVPSDIEIAQQAEMVPITDIATRLGLSEDEWDPYGKYKGKISLSVLKRLENKPDGHLILVTAINPTAAGEGKSTVTVGLGQALNRIGKKAIVAIREPSLGPSFGLKGGAAGGGYAQVVPMEDINLHFTGDLHAITTAHNLLAALLDNHLQQGNQLGIDPRRIVWKRVIDMNDRSLRQIVVGLGGRGNGVPREDGFDITVASEIMAILCLATSLDDMKERIANILIGYSYENQPIYVRDLGAEGAMTLLLKEAIKPNLVQTLENTPALIHGGPFANIAHGCNSILATKMALKFGEYTVTEAGFGADLGAEKFFNIKCRKGNLKPSAVVIVATLRALKLHGGAKQADLGQLDPQAIRLGFQNLEKHIENVASFGLPYVVSLNRFISDDEEELQEFATLCSERHIPFELTNVWEEGGAGGEALAQRVVEIVEGTQSNFHFLYDSSATIEEKISHIVKQIYGGSGVHFSDVAQRQLKTYAERGWDHLPICMAKTQYSLSDQPLLKGRPTDFIVTVRELKPSLGAGFIVALTGDILTMPGLPKVPAAIGMDVTEEGKITGLF